MEVCVIKCPQQIITSKRSVGVWMVNIVAQRVHRSLVQRFRLFGFELRVSRSVRPMLSESLSERWCLRRTASRFIDLRLLFVSTGLDGTTLPNSWVKIHSQRWVSSICLLDRLFHLCPERSVWRHGQLQIRSVFPMYQCADNESRLHKGNAIQQDDAALWMECRLLLSIDKQISFSSHSPRFFSPWNNKKKKHTHGGIRWFVS